ncbi:hypothetical protein FN976_10900 [Caenimonas sedimenti]|uniref:Uncharacterized protein n=1 Tax=Caenimonas sedimenti TaxID=2596921 RepID=A0A562ZSV7_9BURK|nr:hypothetical protein [Caenimonas sedimenti]TWO71418.1 hypothetical protein FN976_10900 [Caenimonas sedimenti]
MKMNEPNRWSTAAAMTCEAFDQLLKSGQAVEVSHRAPKWFGGRVAIEVTTFDRFVAWDSATVRRLGEHLDETDRLQGLLEASAYACFGAGGCFVCRGVDSHGYNCRSQRHVMSVTNLGPIGSPQWLLHAEGSF